VNIQFEYVTKTRKRNETPRYVFFSSWAFERHQRDSYPHVLCSFQIVLSLPSLAHSPVVMIIYRVKVIYWIKCTLTKRLDMEYYSTATCHSQFSSFLLSTVNPYPTNSFMNSIKVKPQTRKRKGRWRYWWGRNKQAVSPLSSPTMTSIAPSFLSNSLYLSLPRSKLLIRLSLTSSLFVTYLLCLLW
jgi:hypothetical protein